MTYAADNQDFTDNLDALARDIADLEQLAEAVLSDEPVDPEVLIRIEAEPGSLDYASLTEHNQMRRSSLSWGDSALQELLTPDQLSAVSTWNGQDQSQWLPEDFVIVGFAGALGVLSAVFDTHLDARVTEGLGWLKSTQMLRRWEVEAQGMPIDYTGYKFGGPAHRVRSAGHDVLRFANALEQVRTGRFRGTYWQDGQKFTVDLAANNYGTPFEAESDPITAIALLLKHWAADVITPMSLPLPGFSLLTELPIRELRVFANEAYAGLELGGLGSGLNLRSGLATPSLSVLAIEVLIRSHIHLQEYRSTGRFALKEMQRRKRAELLLAAHGASAAASLTKAAVQSAVYGPLAVRHINVPALVRTGVLAVEVSRTTRNATRGGPSWKELAEQELREFSESDLWKLAGLLETASSNDAAQ